MKRSLALILPLLLAACQDLTPDSYANPGDPERQLLETSEALDIPLLSKDDLEKLKEALALQKPASATLTCPDSAAACAPAKNLLLKAGVPIEIKTVAKDSPATANVSLLYKHIDAMACENRYQDNRFNSANTAAPQLGCSIRSNMLQMVSDKQQFVNPALLDYMDGDKAAKTYQLYSNPPATGSSADASSSEGSQSLVTGSSGVP